MNKLNICEIKQLNVIQVKIKIFSENLKYTNVLHMWVDTPH